MTSYRTYSRTVAPLNWVLGILLLQFGFWLVAFPHVPTVVDGEPRENDPYALAILVLIFSSLFCGLLLGSHCRLPKIGTTVLSRRFAVSLALLLHLVVTAASILQLQFIILNPASLLLILEPAGINRQAAELRDASFGIPTLVTLWVPALALYLSALNVRLTRGVVLLVAILMINVMIYGTLLMSRTHIISAVLMFLGATVVFRPNSITFRRILASALVIFIIVWSNSLIRTGILVSNTEGVGLLSPYVQRVLFQEFVEKYLAGEFNNSLIIATYEADPGRNFLYGTLFSQFADTFRPDRYLNTMNILGYFYWQFGIFGAALVACLFGALLGAVGKLGWRNAHSGVNFFTLLYIVAFPGFLQVSRINYYFLHYFLVPLIIFVFVFSFCAASRRRGLSERLATPGAFNGG